MIAVLAIAAGCRGSSAPVAERHLAQAAYVWQRNWTPGVRGAVAHPLAALDGLHVLAGEIGAEDDRAPERARLDAELGRAGLDPAASITRVRLDAVALAAAHRPITLVLRISGARPPEGLSLAPIIAIADDLRAAGVPVAGIEIDHDCATARLADYAAWLTAERPPTPLRFSITALPTWAGAAALARVAAAVDDIVVQVHAVRAPLIFDANEAWVDLQTFARAVGTTPLRVALPTYSAVVRGDEVGVDPDDVARFVRRLERSPIAGVGGIVWFRLPVAGDEQTWSSATFARVVTGAAPVARARVALVERGADLFDVVVTNPGETRVDLPAVHVAGSIAEADLVQGYREHGAGRWDAPRRVLAANEQLVIGWIHGKDLELVE